MDRESVLAIFYMREGISDAITDKFKQYDSPNGWGTYNDFCEQLADLIVACKQFPIAKVRMS